jgi:predicted secreted protein
MAATAGKKLRVAVATTLAGTYTNIVGVKSASLKRSGATIDVTTLTDTELVKIMGMRDSQITISGNFELDTTGQKLIRDAFANDTALFAKFQPDGGTTSGINSTVEVKVSDYSITGDTTSEVSVSITLDGTGAVTVA